MKRVLHVYPQLNCGGTEMVFYNLIKFGDRTKYAYELLVQKAGENEEIFRNLGVTIHQIPYDGDKEYKDRLVDFFSKGRYDVVHAHMHDLLPTVLYVAEEAGVSCRVAHSHNARVDVPRFVWPLLYFKHHRYEKYATHLFGCSELALKWLFPANWRKGKVIYNGIDLEKFQFNAQTRQTVRERLGIDANVKVFINVGRCTDQKNQRFILDLAKSRKRKDELYIIVGDGPLFNELRQYQVDNTIGNVRLLGTRSDVAQLLNAADVFLFPSIYEGLGIVAIEAEASGLIVLASNTIPSEADMGLGNFHKIPLKDAKRWHEMLDLSANSDAVRASISEKALSSPYNIKTVTQTVEQLYSNTIK